MPEPLGMLSVVIPARDEEDNFRSTIPPIVAALDEAGICHEIVVVNDGSTDGSEDVLRNLSGEFESVRYVNNGPPNGFGLAVRCGLGAFEGDAVVIVMADGSDKPADIVKLYRKLEEGCDCAFGSRFGSGAKVVDYPLPKLILNRLVNLFIQAVFQIRYNDVTNAFKAYRRHTIDGLEPFLSHHFNLTVELPLKCIVRGYSYGIVPTDWYNRTKGEAKLKIKEMGSRYLFIVLYCLLEKLLSRGDFKRR